MKLFLDACAIIYWVEMALPHYNKFVDLLKQLGKNYNNPLFAASDLSLLECRVKPLREKNAELLERYRNFFCASDLTMVPILPTIIEEASHIRAFHQLRTPDAIQAASALSIPGDVIFVTGDINFKKVPRLKIALIAN